MKMGIIMMGYTPGVRGGKRNRQMNVKPSPVMERFGYDLYRLSCVSGHVMCVLSTMRTVPCCP